jgi:3-isopropylmalate dehydrogenase
MKIVVIPGDGIGPEIMQATAAVLQAVSKRFALALEIQEQSAGMKSLVQCGTTVPEALLQKVKQADGLLLGPMTTHLMKDESKGEINPSKFFRKELDLFANIRPARTYTGVTSRFDPFDLVVVRENTEGFYADRNIESGSSEMLVTPDVVISLRRITRHCCNRIARCAFELAMTRRKHLTIVHKANVLKIADGMFIDICREVGREFHEVTIDDVIVDAMMAHVVRAPDQFDVIVTTNMFGDILSDLTAEMSGSLGLAGSLNAGVDFAMGQAAHGSAPDIAGRDIANPISLILSAQMLLAWYGVRHGLPHFIDAAKRLEKEVSAMLATGQATRDIGGQLGTQALGVSLAKRLLAAD